MTGIIYFEAGEPFLGSYRYTEKDTNKKTQKEHKKTIGNIYFEADKPFLGSYSYT